MSKIRLGDIADIQAGPFGTQLHKDEYVDKGIPMLNSKNIGNGSIVTSSLDYVSPSICSRLPNYVLKTGDILFGRAGTIERHAYLPAQYNGCFQGTNCIRIRCYDEKKALFISYFLWTKQVKQTIENSAGGSIQSYITTDLLKSLFVEIPDNYEEIADLLIALDNKIENNYKIMIIYRKCLVLSMSNGFIVLSSPTLKTYRINKRMVSWNGARNLKDIFRKVGKSNL